MPDPVRFDLAAYCSDPSYPAELEVGLYSNELDLAAGVRLEDLVECSYAGYRRYRGDIWAQRLSATQGGPLLRSKSLLFVCREASLGGIARGTFVLAVISDSRLLVAFDPFPNAYALSAPGEWIQIVTTLSPIQSQTTVRA